MAGKAGETYLRVLIDTGADHSIFPFSVAEDVGAELFHDETDSTKGVGGHEVTIIPGRVQMELLDGSESCRWSAFVGFAKFDSEEGECSILGYSSGLEYFLAAFDGEAQIVELSPGNSFPSND